MTAGASSICFPAMRGCCCCILRIAMTRASTYCAKVASKLFSVESGEGGALVPVIGLTASHHMGLLDVTHGKLLHSSGHHGFKLRRLRGVASRVLSICPPSWHDNLLLLDHPPVDYSCVGESSGIF